MRAMNLFSYTRIPEEYATEYMNMLCQRSHKVKAKPQEFETIKSLVDLLLSHDVPIRYMDGFFFDYQIKQINKEFDLLKVDGTKKILNIELKSYPIADEGIFKQLHQNRYYLSCIAEETLLFTYVMETGQIYKLEGDELKHVSAQELIDVMTSFEDYMTEDIEKLFTPNQYLISPLNTPDQFLNGHYFLTQQQQDIKKFILKKMKAGAPHFLGIKGSAGTGKTLLLYDIVRTIAEEHPCCIIHSGILCDGHEYLNTHWAHVKIVPAKEIGEECCAWLKDFNYIFIDETQRIYTEDLEFIVKYGIENKVNVVFSYDYEQYLSSSEKERNIPGKLQKISGYTEYSLSEKIRTSPEISSFYRNVFNLKHVARGYLDYSAIDVIYANDEDEAKAFIELYEKQFGYTFISYTSSFYKDSPFDRYPSNYDTHHVIGQEFDKVLILLDHNFMYSEDGLMSGKEHPNPDYLFYKLLYQDISRARSNLCILVVDNYELFLQISDIKYGMLERYQYKTNATNSGFSFKQLSKYSKTLKDLLDELEEEDRQVASDNVDIMVDQLTSVEINKKILRNSVHFLRRIMKDNPEATEFGEVAKNFIHFVEPYY